MGRKYEGRVKTADNGFKIYHGSERTINEVQRYAWLMIGMKILEETNSESNSGKKRIDTPNSTPPTKDPPLIVVEVLCGGAKGSLHGCCSHLRNACCLERAPESRQAVRRSFPRPRYGKPKTADVPVVAGREGPPWRSWSNQPHRGQHGDISMASASSRTILWRQSYTSEKGGKRYMRP